jgi:hypothetical protein
MTEATWNAVRLPVVFVAVFILTLILFRYMPGGVANDHLWLSEQVLPASEHDKQVYAECLHQKESFKAVGMETVCIDPATQISFIHIDLKTDRVKPQARGCWDLDICLRHGETRIFPCKTP